LRIAAADVTEELSPEEESRIAAMRSATPEWQQRVAARMAGVEQSAGPADAQLSPQPAAAKPRWITWRSSRSAWALAGAFAFSVAIVAFVLIRARSPHDGLDETNRLIAEAYTQQRGILFRIPGAAYAPYRGTRGAKTELPASLDMANFKVKTAKKRGDKDARWLVASANAKILEADYGGAVEILEAVTNGDNYIPGADLALATAYYERGIQNRSTVDLGNAREAIGHALEREPGNPVALFNLARLDQEIGLFSQAADDWTKYLQAEPAGDWSREARENLAICQQEVERKTKQADGHSLLTPEAIGGAEFSNSAQNLVDSRIEDYQLRVFLSDFPALVSAPPDTQKERHTQYERAIRGVGEISAMRHRDRLFRDLLSSGGAAREAAPAHALASAIAANRAGDEDLALKRARESDAGFERLGNRAGSFRARFEMIYALQFMTRTRECIALANQLARDSTRAGYASLSVAAETQAGFCENMNGNLSEAARHLKRAETEAQEAGYEAALDRARVGLAAMELQSGSVIGAWNLAVTGLKHFWATPLPLERGESFCDLLDIAAEENRQWHLQSAVLMEALSLLELQSDRLAEAQVLVRLAGSLLMLHRSAEATSYWTKALSDFESAPQTAATRNQELTVRINLAKAQAAAQDYSSSVSQLEQLRPQLRDLHEDLSLIEFYTTLGEGYRKLGNAPRAEEADLEAIRVFRQGLASLNHDRDRLTWYRQISSAYRSLVQLRINENQSADALLIWQEYRRAGMLPDRATSAPPSGLRQGMPDEAQVMVVYAGLPDGLFAWTVSHRHPELFHLSASYDSVARLAYSFSRQCSLPSSDLVHLSDEGSRLYDILIQPLSRFLPEGSLVAFEPDDELARIPFSALLDRQGRYLNSTYTIEVAPFGAVPGLAAAAKAPGANDPALLLESRTSLLPGLPEDPQAAREIEAVALFFPHATTLGVEPGVQDRFLRLLKHSAIFHYAGHSATSANGGALILRERDPAGTERLIELRSDDLDGLRLANGKLAVLSACRTDRGQGDHWLDRDNIAVTLLSAGFHQVVASRWERDSSATTTLMLAFYRSVTEGGSVPLAYVMQRRLRVNYHYSSTRISGRHFRFWSIQVKSDLKESAQWLRG
jgi:CHAT domain-containing protein